MKCIVPLLGLLLFASPVAAQRIGSTPGGSRPGPLLDHGPPRPARGPLPSFGPVVEFELSGSEPSDHVLTDFDGDGNLDLGFSLSGGSEVTVLYGDGLGGFPRAEETRVVLSAYDPGAWGIGAGDFDDDGFLDFAVALGSQYNGLGQPNRKVNVFLSDGDCRFDFAGTLEAVGTFPIDCEGGDFDEDGVDDLLVVSNTSGVCLFPSLGDGTFGPVRILSTKQNLLRCEAVDLDRDGHLDAVVSQAGVFPYHFVYWGDGTGWPVGTPVEQGLGPGYGFACADLNGDGHLDLASSVPDKFPNYAGGLWVHLGSGGRSYGAPRRFGSAFTGGLAVGDVNHDGYLDVVGLDGTYYANVRPYIGRGDGTFVQAPNVTTTYQPSNLVLADWDADGLDDLAYAERYLGETPYLRVQRNTTK